MITTTGIKYLGSKASFVDAIIQATTDLGFTPKDTVALDMFTGTTRVAQAYRQRGYTAITSDLLPASRSYAETWITNPSANRTLLQEMIILLNQLSPKEGWLTQYYGEAQPVEDKGAGKLVNAFTRANAMKADAIRDAIALLSRELLPWETDTLVTSLILALNDVQNSQGHSRAFFRDFMSGAQNPLTLTLPPLVGDPRLSYHDDETFLQHHPVGIHYEGSVLTREYQQVVNKACTTKRVVAYVDPPYTTNLPYNQFYHLWDSIALWDKPEVVGSTNRRADRQSKRDGGAALSSTFAVRNQARSSFEQLLQGLSTVAEGLVISYSSDSIVCYDDMVQLIHDCGYALLGVDDRQYVRHALGKSATASEETRRTAEKYNTEWLFKATRR